MEDWCSDPDRRIPNNSDRNLSQCHFPQKVPQGLAWDRTRLSAVRDQLRVQITKLLIMQISASRYYFCHISPVMGAGIAQCSA